MGLLLDLNIKVSKKDLLEARLQMEQLTPQKAKELLENYVLSVENLLKHKEIKEWYNIIEKRENESESAKYTPFSLTAEPYSHSYIFVQYLALHFHNLRIAKAFTRYLWQINRRHKIMEETAGKTIKAGTGSEMEKYFYLISTHSGYLNAEDVTYITDLIRSEYEKDPGVFHKIPNFNNLRGNHDSLPKYITIPSHAAAHAVRRALAMGDKWKTEAGKDWPIFDLTNRTRSLRGSAWIQPPKVLYGVELEEWQTKMLEHARKRLDDLTADIYDAFMVEWWKRATYPQETILITLDQIMEYRALKPKKDKQGRRRGHRKEDKEKIDQRVMALTGVYVKFDEITVTVEEPNGKRKQKTIQAEGPLLQIDVRYSEKEENGEATILGYECRPGLPVAFGLYGSGQAHALLARIALEMDPYRQKYEKRLLRYFSYLWRTRQQNGNYNRCVKVGTLLEEIGLELEKKNPNRTKERLEQALNTLVKHEAFACWEYDEKADEYIIGRRGWFEKWLEWNISVEPAAFIMEYYTEKINNHAKKKELPIASQQENIGERIRKERKKRGISIAVAAEQINISKGMLSLIENKKKNPGPRVLPKIEKWLNRV